jgi:biopolymer transport protein TolR
MAGGVSEGRSRRGRKRVMAEINVVPYIDVTLVLLIIFMITAPLVTQSVQVELPKVASVVAEPSEEEPVNVTIDKQGQVYIDIGDNPETPVDEESMVTRLAAVMKYKPTTQIYLSGDTAVNYGRVLEVFAALNSAGIQNVGLRSDPLDAKASR